MILIHFRSKGQAVFSIRVRTVSVSVFLSKYFVYHTVWFLWCLLRLNNLLFHGYHPLIDVYFNDLSTDLRFNTFQYYSSNLPPFLVIFIDRKSHMMKQGLCEDLRNLCDSEN